MQSERLHWLDAAKGIGILLVISGHVLDGAMAQHILNGSWAPVLYRLIYMFHMPFFFLLSGYAFANHKVKNSRGGMLKCLNLLILYVFWFSFMYIFRKIFSLMVNTKYESSLMTSLLTGATTTPYWYLITLFYYYILGYVLIWLDNRKINRAIWCIALIFAAFMPFIFHKIFALDSDLEDYIYKVLYHLVYFLIGCGMFKIHGEGTKGRSVFWLPVVGLAFLVTGVAFPDVIDYPFIRLLIALTASLGLLQLIAGSRMIAENKLLCYLGSNSIYIYLVHNYFTVLCRIVYQRLGMNIPDVCYIVGSVCIAAAASVLVCRVAQKIWPLDIFFKPVVTVRRILKQGQQI